MSSSYSKRIAEALEPCDTLLAVWRAQPTSTSKNLATLKGSALSADLTEIILVPHDSTETITFNNGTANANSARVPANGLSLAVNKAMADTLEFYSASTVNMTVVEMG